MPSGCALILTSSISITTYSAQGEARRIPPTQRRPAQHAALIIGRAFADTLAIRLTRLKERQPWFSDGPKRS